MRNEEHDCVFRDCKSGFFIDCIDHCAVIPLFYNKKPHSYLFDADRNYNILHSFTTKSFDFDVLKVLFLVMFDK